MCFSLTASLVSGSLLVSVGVYTLVRAQQLNKDFRLFAAIPIIFGVQQLIEGVVWNRIEVGDPHGVYLASLIYMFFAYFLWPVYIPATVMRTETKPHRYRVMKSFFALGIVVALLMYLPIVFGYFPLKTYLTHYSITYQAYQSNKVLEFYGVFYALAGFVPLFISSRKSIRHFGILLALAYVISYAFYYYAFTSIWCFLAALMSLYIVYVVNSLANGKAPAI